MTSSSPLDLAARARQEMLAEGFLPDVPAAVAAEMTQLPNELPFDPAVRDLRELPWSSIDNSDSRDLDQLEVLQPLADGRIRLLVAIADVAAYVPRDSVTDVFAATNTTSIYTAVAVFPMLPLELSADKTSLLPNTDRLAIVTDTVIDAAGALESTNVYAAIVHSYARLDYESVGAWLEGGDLPAALDDAPVIVQQLQQQHRLALRLNDVRHRNGSLDFASTEATPIVRDGQVVDLAVPVKNQARMMIENFMILANMALAKTLLDRGISAIQRVVRSPERWDRIVAVAAEYGYDLPAEPNAPALAAFLNTERERDPLRFPDVSLTIIKLLGAGDYTVVRSADQQHGHFGLAVSQYTHSTAPNRRYVDLVTQRVVKATLAGLAAPYSDDELEAIATHCNERESAARKVERRMRKVAAVDVLHDALGRDFDALVTGVSGKGTYIRVLQPPVEGRLVRGNDGLDIGDRVHVRLIATDADHGFIDFERVENSDRP